MNVVHIVKNTLFQSLSRLVTTLTTLLVTFLLARSLGAAGYGDFTKVITTVSLFYVVVDFGLNAVFLQDRTSFSFKTLLFVRMATALVFVLALYALVFFLPYSRGVGFSDVVKNGILIFSLTLLAQAVIQSCSAVFQEKRKYVLLFLSLAGGSLATLLLLFVHGPGGPLTLQQGLTALVAGFIVSAGIGLIAVARYEDILSQRIAGIKKLLLGSLPLGLMLFFNLLYFRADMVILTLYKSSFDVGVYGLSYRVFDFLLTLPLFLSNSLYPYLLDDEKNNRNSTATATKYLVLSIAASFILVGAFWVASPLLIFIDNDFSHAIIPFRILLLFLPVFFITSILQWILIAKRQQRFLIAPYIVVGLINIGLNILFIPKGSYVAAAIITGASEVLIGIVLTLKIFLFTKNMQNGK